MLLWKTSFSLLWQLPLVCRTTEKQQFILQNCNFFLSFLFYPFLHSDFSLLNSDRRKFDFNALESKKKLCFCVFFFFVKNILLFLLKLNTFSNLKSYNSSLLLKFLFLFVCLSFLKCKSLFFVCLIFPTHKFTLFNPITNKRKKMRVSLEQGATTSILKFRQFFQVN